MTYNILPYPQKTEYTGGVLSLDGLTVATGVGMEHRVVRAAVELRAKLSALTGRRHTYKQQSGFSDGLIMIAVDPTLSHEEYTLDVTAEGIRISGGDGAGCFYGIKTLEQILTQCGSQIACLHIEDKPGMAYRGFYHDATRGRVPTLESMKALADLIASYKGNSLQLYVEHTFDFAEFAGEMRSPQDFLTAEELLDLDEYCYDRFIDFVPSLATFGHLFELLSRREYAHLCELQDYTPGALRWFERMAHHTINPSQEESIELVCSLIDQYLPLFRSEYFNICCDETFDLGRGANAGKDTAALYVEFVNKISAHVRASGKKVMMWSDIIMHHPEQIGSLNEESVLLNWNYSPECNDNAATTLGQSGYDQIVCPGNTSWNRLVEDITVGVPNITRMARFGYENEAVGILNTNWGDFGHIAPVGSCLYGTVLGLCAGWNRVHTTVDEEYDRALCSLLYGVEENIVPMLADLGRASFTAYWRMIAEYSFSANKAHISRTPEELENAVAVCRDACRRLSSMTDKNGRLASLILSARGLEVMNRMLLAIVCDENLPVDEINRWYADYAADWRATSKESELAEIGACLNRAIALNA